MGYPERPEPVPRIGEFCGTGVGQGTVKMKCPICAQAALVGDVRDIPYTYKGKNTTLPAVTGDFCPACGEVILEATGCARISALMLEFNK
jgi:YgiT-type zinc finger domain-containing protein